MEYRGVEGGGGGGLGGPLLYWFRMTCYISSGTESVLEFVLKFVCEHTHWYLKRICVYIDHNAYNHVGLLHA